MSAYDIREICERLPHRYPLLLVDRVEEVDAGKRLVAVGEFHCAGPEVVNHVAAWDGARWSALGAGIDWGPTGLRCATAFDDGSGPALYVDGRFAGPNGAPAANVAR